ncbi:MAG: DNA polymerase, partial [bacterium]
GQSAYGLAKQLLVPNKEAKRFIDGFYSEFTGVKEYKERILAEAREKGYVTTYLGRKRFLRDINSQNHLARQNAERMAFNAVFQGSAADLIKKAMIAIQSRLEQDHLKTKMILQVHDELLFEVPQDELSTVRSFIVDLMETTFTLSIPLKVTCHEGKTWAEAH